MAFNIGDRVRLKEWDELNTATRNKGMARMCGKIGTVTDKLYSEAANYYLYSVDFDDFVRSTKMWEEELLVPYAEHPVTYCYEFDYLDNVVVARFYEIKGEEKIEIARGHGHIIHEGPLGIAQASSYALKRIYYKISEMLGE
jgi:hypothetical protein